MRRTIRSQLPRLLAAALACLAACALAACSTRRGESNHPAARNTDNRPPGRRLTVLTYNIHHGEGVDGRLDLGRIAQVILDHQPDLVALQEVDVKTRRTGGVDQPAEFARLTGMNVAFGKAIDYQGGDYGQLVLSRFPILRTETHGLPGTSGVERRIAHEAAVRPWPDGPEVRFITTHLDHRPPEGDRFRQAAEINRLFAGAPAAAGDDDSPVILAGDFNAEPNSETMRAIFRHWTDAASAPPADSAGADDASDLLGTRRATYPSADPRKRIDYILLRPTGGAWRVVSCRVVPETVASDHSPVTAVLEWRGR